MSLFSVGGNIGFAIGPVLVTPLVLVFGLHGTLFLIVPTWLMAAVLVHELPRLRTFRADLEGGRVQRTEARAAWGPFVILARRDRPAVVRLLRVRHVRAALLRRTSCTRARASPARR